MVAKSLLAFFTSSGDLVSNSNTMTATECVSRDLCMRHERCPGSDILVSTGGTLHKLANSSVEALAVHTNVWAVWFCSQRPLRTGYCLVFLLAAGGLAGWLIILGPALVGVPVWRLN